MDQKCKDLFAARALVFKALAHSTRLYIIERLADRDYCVCELTELIGADISTVSKHLTILRNAGLVSSDKKGTAVHYKLRVPCVLNFFSCVEGVLKSNSLAQQRLLA